VSKKDKKMSRANPYFINKFCLFCLAHGKSWLFVEQLGACIGCEDVHATFFFSIFLTIQNMFKFILNKGSICTPEPKSLSPKVGSVLKKKIN
jgi:hypothetical protein